MKTWIVEHMREAVGLVLALVGISMALAGTRWNWPTAVGLGYTIAASTLITLTIGRLTRDDVVDTVRNALRRVPVMQGAIEGGVINVYGQRHGNQRAMNDMCSMLETAFRNDEEVLLVAVAVPGLLESGTRWGDAISRYGGGRMKAILLDPNGRWADVRADMERPHQTKEHIRASLNVLREARVESGTVDMPPVAFLLGTSRVMFVQPYPLVDRPTLERLDPDFRGGPIGGQCPMIQLRGGTPGHRFWYSHFWYLWKNREVNWVPLYTP